MKPILFEKTETIFASNGIGTLIDVTSCYVVEERNGKYELTIQISADDELFPEITHSRIILAKVNDNTDGSQLQPFSIYYISKPINRIVTVKAEHISYQLSYIPVEPFTATTAALALYYLKNSAVTTCPFTFTTDIEKTKLIDIETPVSMRAALGGIKGSILDTYGGELKFDKWNVYLLNNRGADNGVIIRYGKNLTDINQEENLTNVYTSVMPYWTDNNTVMLLAARVVDSSTASSYPYKRIEVVDFSSEFDEQPTDVQLRTAAENYITQNNIGYPKVSIKVSFAALWQTEEYKDIAALEKVMLCDTVLVDFPPLNISVSAKVVKTKYNVLLERYDEITLGDYTRKKGRTW